MPIRTIELPKNTICPFSFARTTPRNTASRARREKAILPDRRLSVGREAADGCPVVGIEERPES
jgi:hypothetical protein